MRECITGVFAQLLGLKQKTTFTTQLYLVAGGLSFYREKPLLPRDSSRQPLFPIRAPRKVITVDYYP